MSPVVPEVVEPLVALPVVPDVAEVEPVPEAE
jgi:hypothetical protein